MRYAKTGAAVLAGLVVVALVVVFATGKLSWQSHEAINTQAIIAKAAAYHVTIRRDTWGVPHIEGARDTDVAFGLGFSHSEDDFETIQDVALATRGELAAREGAKAAPIDYLVHLFRVWDAVNAKYKTLPSDVRAVVEAYADGINYYGALHPDKVASGLLPLTGKDIVAGFVLKLPFFYGLDGELKRLLKKTGGTPPPEIGSNGAAVAPSRTPDGATRLLVNSHQPYTGPVAWYEAVLQSGEGWHVAGGFFPGSPFMLHGFNEHLGWANTVNKPDLTDFYKLRINPDNENQYWFDGHWRDFEKRDVTLRVKIWGPFIWTVHRPVLWAAQGPVLETDHGTYAIRYAGMGEIRQVEQYYRLDKAQNLQQWRAAMALNALPSINYIYADEKGNIGYVYNGEFPARKPGIDWQGYIPGDRSDLIWHKYLPFSKVPQIWNPKSGFVFNSNNTPFVATAPEDDLKPSDFPKWMGIQTNMTNRAWRALENFGGDTSISAADFRKYKFDLIYSSKSEFMENVRETIALPAHGDKDMEKAQDILRHWDHKTDVSDRGTALAVFTVEPVMRAKLEHTKPVALADSFHDAIGWLKSHFGRLDPEWGKVNRIVRGTHNLAIDGGPDIYRAVYGEKQPDGTLKAIAGDTLIIFVTWDKDGKVSAQSIHQFGSATLDKSSPHYADQLPLFVAMKTKPVWFTDAELKGHIEASYHPGEKHKP